MSAKIKIRGGTASDNTRLCDTCSSCTTVLGSKPSEEMLICNALAQRVTWQVSHCTLYRKYGDASLYDMRLIAWPIAADKKGNSIGFVSPDKFHKMVEDGKAAPIEDNIGYD